MKKRISAKAFTIVVALMMNFTILAQTSTSFHAWASTPPMGWNSWDCYGPTVVESEVKANADYMSAKLKKYGWEYIVVDIRWYVGNDKAHGYNEKDAQYTIDSFGRFQPAINRFPSSQNGQGFRPLADYIHAKGLKFGIHIMRGIPKVAVEHKTPLLGTKYNASEIYNQENLCKWLKDMYTVDSKKPGAQEYYNSLFNMYAAWGVDFIKIDDLSAPVYHADEIEMIRKAIDQTGRKILLSTSPGETPINFASHIQNNANMWRTVDDLWDNWKMLKDHFDVFRRWNTYRVVGGWPDGDMLPLGHIGIRAERGKDRMSLLTKDEQKTMITLWAMFKSPLMFGGNLPDNDAFTDSLLTNRKVLRILTASQDNHEFEHDSTHAVWIASDPQKHKTYLAVFDIDDHASLLIQSHHFKINLKGTGLKDEAHALGIWDNKSYVLKNGVLDIDIPTHGVVLMEFKH